MSIFNPVVILVGITTLIVYGVGFFEYLVVSWLVSAAIGWWAERKMIAYDRAIRQVASKLTGVKHPGDNVRLARMIRNLCKLLGPPTMCIFPAVIAVFGMHYACRTSAVLDGRAFRVHGAKSTTDVEKEVSRIVIEHDIRTITPPRKRPCGYTYVY